jgi:hypothetical protein
MGGVIRHKYLPMVFSEYNKETQRYGVPSRLKFCFPSYPKDASSDMDGSDVGTELKAFYAAERILLEMYHLLKSSFARTNWQAHSMFTKGDEDFKFEMVKTLRGMYIAHYLHYYL